MIVEVVPAGPVTGRLAAPASKSVTNRLLVMAALADGISTLRGPLRSDDTEAMRAAVTALGATVGDVAEGWRVEGTGGRLRVPGQAIDARLSGTTMRFIMAMAALAPGSVEVTGQEGLLARPVAPLTAALRRLGAHVHDHDGFPPVRAGGGISGGDVVVGGKSSQFASAVLLAAPYAADPVRVHVAGATAVGYVALTIRKMQQWGADATAGDPCSVHPSAYEPRAESVEYDASAAAHLLALAMATGGTVTVTNAAEATAQPDADLARVLTRMGATVARDGDALTVTGPDRPQALDLDLHTMPDQLPTVATLAALAPGETRITGVAVTRGHETDRVAALHRELGKLGVGSEQQPDGLVVRGGDAAGPAQIDPHGDHRMAMAFAALAARVPGLRISDAGCVAKTYPAFWDDAATLGLVLR